MPIITRKKVNLANTILGLLSENGQLPRTELAKKFRVSPAGISQLYDLLLTCDRIEKRGKGRGTRYIVKERTPLTLKEIRQRLPEVKVAGRAPRGRAAARPRARAAARVGARVRAPAAKLPSDPMAAVNVILAMRDENESLKAALAEKERQVGELQKKVSFFEELQKRWGRGAKPRRRSVKSKEAEPV